MNRYLKKSLCVLLTVTFAFSLASCSGGKVSEGDIKSLFKDTSKISFSYNYTELKDSRKNKTKSWRQGMVSGNGLQGFITSGSPYSDTFIFQNMHFIMPNENQRTCPQTYDELETVYPLLVKSANYWSQLMTPEYYTAKDGSIHYEEGKTSLNDGETYCILPSYSPENNPSNYNSPSDANCAIDISACRDNLNMLIKVMGDIDKSADTSKWRELEKNLPPYLYDETGALKEWATTSFDENNKHRHLSHLYGVWPLFETQGNDELSKACKQAIANRQSENEASHALVHRSLIASRLKDSDSLTDALVKLVNHKIRYDSLMTNHDYDQGSCYCTDFAIGYLGIINEALVYSHNNDIEFLPALPNSGFENGTLKGIKTRNRATVTELKWADGGKTISATVTSDIDQKLNIKAGGKSQTVEFKAGESKTFRF